MLNKKVAIISIILTSLIAKNSFASNDNKFYGGVGLGIIEGDFTSQNFNSKSNTISTSGLAIDFYGGYKHNITDKFSISPEFFISGNSYDYSFTKSYGTSYDKFELETSVAYGVKSKIAYDITDKIYTNLILGYSLVNAQSTITDYNNFYSNGKSTKSLIGDSVVYGFGIGYKFDENTTIGIDYETASYDFDHTTELIDNYDVKYKVDINNIQLKTSYYF